MKKNEIIPTKKNEIIPTSHVTDIAVEGYTVKVNLKVTPVKAVRKTVYGQGTLTDEEWIEFQEILQEVVDELSKKEME